MGGRARWVVRCVLAMAAAGCIRVGPVSAQTAPLAWDLVGEAEVVPGAAGTALRFRSGSATLRDVTMRDGVISFRVRAPNARSFVGWRLRLQDDGSHEHFYLRPHKTNLPDALQYAPAFQGGRGSEWQVYHGRKGSAAAPTQDEIEGVRMAIVLSGDSAAWFVGYSDEPAMVVPRLAHGAGSGGVRFSSSVAAPTASERPVVIDEIDVREGETVPFALPAVDPLPPGTVTRWGIGTPVLVDEVETSVRPGTSYRAVPTEPDGTLLINRHVTPPTGRSAGVSVAAGLTLTSPDAREVALELGYSDAVTVLLNGRRLYSGDQSYSFAEPERPGLVVPGQTVLYLPLDAGDNRLEIVVTDSFGGWALAARVDDAGVGVAPLG